MSKDADARAYWEERLKGGPALDTVGWLGLGPSFNEWMYRVRAWIFLRRLRAWIGHRRLEPNRMRVLDIGSGSGFYLDLWKKLGVANISGSDLTAAAVQALRQRYPDLTFTQADITSESLPFQPGTFDAISCMDVLFHIVDDAGFERALTNCASLLRPGGLFVFTENCLHGQEVRAPHQVSRTLASVERALSNAGLHVLERRPVFVLMNTPIDSPSLALRRFWNILKVARRHPWLSFVNGMLLYPIELMLTSVLREGPSTEMLVCTVDR